eukprot:10734897-Heterocapsa_arctica.AAC.3
MRARAGCVVAYGGFPADVALADEGVVAVVPVVSLEDDFSGAARRPYLEERIVDGAHNVGEVW